MNSPQPERRRRAELERLFQEGLTYEEIGARLGVTRQRVQQMVARDGLRRNRSQQVYESQIVPRSEEIVELFLQLRSDEEVAAALDLPAKLVKRAVDEFVPDANILRRRQATSSPVYGDQELLESLRFASRVLPVPFSHEQYNEWSRHEVLRDGRPRPGPQSAMHRFRGWRAALTAAGLPANPSAGPTARFDLDFAVDALVVAWQQLGHAPTVRAYEQWSHHPYPSQATIRHLVGNWNNVLLAAWPLVHGRPLPGFGSIERAPYSPIRVEGERAGPTPGLGVTYSSAVEDTQIPPTDPFERDPQLLERALNAHMRLQNSLAAILSTFGFEPLSPGPGDPEFDVAWKDRMGTVHIVEVKSATPTNMENQLRIGMAQLLRYGEVLRVRGFEVVLGLLVERPIVDSVWESLLDRLAIRVVGPDSMANLLD
jgi:hypothetical protein